MAPAKKSVEEWALRMEVVDGFEPPHKAAVGCPWEE